MPTTLRRGTDSVRGAVIVNCDELRSEFMGAQAMAAGDVGSAAVATNN